MYLVHLKSLVVSALRDTFGSTYPQTDFADTKVGIEYPVDAQSYPSVWVDYDDDAPLQRAGIDHREVANLGTDLEPLLVPFTRWRFQGTVSLTVVALSSLERDRLYDEVLRVLAFGNENDDTAGFRTYIESNEFIACNMNFDSLLPRGNAAAPGTPWGTDEIIYERGINVDVLGEFIADRITGALIPLSAIHVVATEELITLEDLTVVEVLPEAGQTDWH